jgi:hypothetical protein
MPVFTLPNITITTTVSQSYVTTDGQSASLSWYKAPIRGLRPDFYFRTEYGIRLTVTFLIPWGALSDERTGLSLGGVAGPCQRSLSRVLVPWDLETGVYCLRFETSLFVASYDSQGHGGGIRPRLHTNALSFITQGEPKRDHYLKQSVTTSICCCGNVLTEPLPSTGLFRVYSLQRERA